MQRSVAGQQSTVHYLHETTTDNDTIQRSTLLFQGPLEQEHPTLTKESDGTEKLHDKCDASLSDNTVSLVESDAIDLVPITKMFAQIIEMPSWEEGSDEEEDECDAVGSEPASQSDDIRGAEKVLANRLRQIADKMVQDKLLDNNAEVENTGTTPYIREVATKIASSTTFEKFMEALPSEAAKTIGWEQVALYSYIIHTSIMMVRGINEVRECITNNANQYFRSTYSQWINSRPRGWNSIFDETNVD